MLESHFQVFVVFFMKWIGSACREVDYFKIDLQVFWHPFRKCKNWHPFCVILHWCASHLYVSNWCGSLVYINDFFFFFCGQIRIDGQDIRDVTLESLRKSIGVVPQDTVRSIKQSQFSFILIFPFMSEITFVGFCNIIKANGCVLWTGTFQWHHISQHSLRSSFSYWRGGISSASIIFTLFLSSLLC